MEKEKGVFHFNLNNMIERNVWNKRSVIIPWLWQPFPFFLIHLQSVILHTLIVLFSHSSIKVKVGESIQSSLVKICPMLPHQMLSF